MVSIESIMNAPMSDIMVIPSDRVKVYNTDMFPQIIVNGTPLGSTSIPTELIKVNHGDRDVLVQIFYDEGSQLSLCNKWVEPLVLNSRPSDKPIRIGSVVGDTSKIRSIESITLGSGRQMEAVNIADLALHTCEIQRPLSLSKYDNNWAV